MAEFEKAHLRKIGRVDTVVLLSEVGTQVDPGTAFVEFRTALRALLLEGDRTITRARLLVHGNQNEATQTATIELFDQANSVSVATVSTTATTETELDSGFVAYTPKAGAKLTIRGKHTTATGDLTYRKIVVYLAD